ncbi:hypothetical protein [Gordonia alkaliphila]|uniref:Uncharacterized protein n=1 Tax=Gordonia alkaliphila TaxID=1053547 RepID=A0ABP8ZD51_9ACTN
MSDVTPQEMRDEADRLDREAALLEKWAAERYDDSARLYRGGSSTFVMSIDTADGYMKEARQMRIDARDFRLIADLRERQAAERAGGEPPAPGQPRAG